MLKKAVFRAPKAKTEEIKKEQQDFKDGQPDLAFSNLVFLDETGLTTSLSQRLAFALKGGEPATLYRRTKGERRTIIGAIGTDGRTVFSVLDKGLRITSFKDFIEEKLLQILHKGDILIMDNLNVHKNKGCLELLASKGIIVLFQPRYSPEFNPIELTWAWMKQVLRRGPERKIELLAEQAIEKLKLISTDLCEKWARKCGYVKSDIKSKIERV
jgi:transposase